MKNTLLVNLAELMYRLNMASKYGGGLLDYFDDFGIEEYDLCLEAEAIEFIPVLLNRARNLPINIYCLEKEEIIVKAGLSGKTYITVKPFEKMKQNAIEKVLVTCCRWNYQLFTQIKKMNYKNIPLGSMIDYSLYKRVVLEECQNYLKSRKVASLFTKFPSANRIKNQSVLEQYLSNNSVYGFIKETAKYGLDIEEVVLNTEAIAEIKNGVVYCADKKNEKCNYINGFRVTTDIPMGAKRRIWVFGPSIVSGFLADDEHTICSSLQRQINKFCEGGAERNLYAVVNASNYSANAVEDVIPLVKRLPIEEGDICIFHMEYPLLLLEKYNEIIDIAPFFNRPHNYGEIFVDINHMIGKGYCVQGEILFNLLKENGYFDKESSKLLDMSLNSEETVSKNGLSIEENQELQVYLNSLKKYRKKIGAIVMNCNPFTLGHRYLIEESAKKVEELFIFVVEEDKSFFPFSDRIELVRKGTQDLKNVRVLPSGKFIISTRTFAAYSNKAELQNQKIDASLDVDIFAKSIAPTLGITIRFAGEEPLDNVTLQYNQTMQRILPKYGIEFSVIPRKMQGEEVISASRVRKLLENRDFKAIAKCVPQTTLEYLQEKYK